MGEMTRSLRGPFGDVNIEIFVAVRGGYVEPGLGLDA